jgi:hypothetical protein
LDVPSSSQVPNTAAPLPAVVLSTLRRQTFQYFGLDFLVDAGLHPWLMEVNATPSMKVVHEAPATQQLIQQQKWDFVRDTFALLRIQQHMFDEVRGTGLGSC